MRCLEPDQAQSKFPVALYLLISLFSKSSWIKTTASRLSYELGVNGKKKSMKTGILLIKMNIASSFHTHFTRFGKPGNFNSLREVI